MANFATLIITFNGGTDVGDALSFDVNNIDTQVSYPVLEVGTTLRSNPNEFTVYPSSGRSAYFLERAVSLDYGAALSSVESNSVVTITSNDYNEFFENISVPPNATFQYIGPIPPFLIDEVTAQQADLEDKNTHVRFNISVKDGVQPYNITSPVIKAAPTNGDLFFDFFRQIQPRSLSITDDNLSIATDTLPTADYFTLDDVTVNEGQSGATVIADINLIQGVISSFREYSINNQDWRSSSSFTGLDAGNYTMYVRDNYGAFYSLPFEVTGVVPGKLDPYHEIVNANTLRFIQEQTFGCDLIPNWDNALFADILRLNFPNVEKRNYHQLISDCDTIPTQIRTNYDNVDVKIYKDGELFLSPTAELKKDNIQQKDKRDCVITTTTTEGFAGKTFLYYQGGDIYTPDTNDKSGEYGNKEKKIFPFAENGQTFTISGTPTMDGEFEQLGTTYDLTTGFSGIVLDLDFDQSYTVQSAIVQVLYNEQVYNIWEFNTVGTALTEGCYHTEIELTDNDVRYEDIKYISEPLKKINSTYGTVLFESRNGSENTIDIDFTTQIVLTMRVEGRFIVPTNTEETTPFRSQKGKVIILKNTVLRGIPFESSYVPFYISEKIALLSGLDDLKINKVQFAKGEDVEVENKAAELNPFVVINRSYEQNNQVTISDSVGISVDSQRVLGTTTTTVIGI